MPDERSYRVALVADRYVNPEPGQLDGLAEALARVGVAVPDRIVPASAARLREFLSRRPAPRATAAPE
jgi:hypothetical protein